MTTLEAMNIIVKQDGDISMCPDLLGFEKDKKGIVIKVGAPATSANMIMSEDYLKALFIVNKNELKQIRDQNPNYSKLIENAPEILEGLKQMVSSALADNDHDRVLALRQAKEIIKKVGS